MSEVATPRVNEVRGVLLPITDHQLLLPNAVIAEVVDYAQPNPIDDAPDWLLGTLNWRHRSVPIIAFERMLDRAFGLPGHRARIAICHTVAETAKRPFVGLVAASIPRLVRIQEGILETGDPDEPDWPVISAAKLGDDDALVPDLDQIEALSAQHF